MNINLNKDTSSTYKFIQVLPLLAFAAVIPLIVRLKVLPVDRIILDFWNHSEQNFDYFSYYKSISIVFAAVLAIAAMMAGFALKNIAFKKTYIYIPVVIFGTCIILSILFSDYRNTALYGFPDRYEGAIVLLSYLAVFFATINLVNEEVQVKLVLGSLLVSTSFICVIGILQVFGLDVFDTALGKSIILPPQFKDFTGSIRSSIDDMSAVSTLYNSNSFGLYMSMLFPLSFTQYLSCEKSKFRVIYFFTTCLIFSSLIASNSRASYISMIVTTIIITFILRRRIINHLKQIILVFLCFILIFIGLNYQSSGYINSRMGSALTAKDMHAEDAAVDKIKDFEIDNGQLALFCTNSELKLAVVNSQLKFFDENGNILSEFETKQNGEILLKEKKYADFSFMVDKNLVKVQKGKSYLFFAVIENNFYFLSSKGEVIRDFSVETLGFEGKERLASGRGYIWSRTLPLLSDTIFWGHGPDTFAMYFPQNDFKGKLNFMYDAYLIVDKPHNMYLQTAMNTGVLSLFAFLCILAYYIVDSIKLFRKETFESFFSKTSLAIFISVIGYSINGLFSDSTVSVAPVFWVLLGLGISINFNIKNLSERF